MKEGRSIINTTSVNAYKGNAKLLDYTATKGAIVAFTHGLSLQLVDRGIRQCEKEKIECRHALKHMKEGGSIINTTSVNAYKGNAKLLDYTVTKGAIMAFTRGLSLQLVDRGIRVNGVAPGPIWTPLIPASFTEDESSNFDTYAC
ncbi:NAD(P)-binding Rossmann-fold superfamily protein [Striga hermonthica]|uniref:NAD(P)-binding Rossmann-fold superfamily protein n=1 Tax=Striga hermonthica TaxID=68872 RepID=A0A9N7R773_STRHE|nr:NAD(P)-binding Rossmann-fold superfamily protein [Striga hermonthica]